jgi:cullin 3
MTMDEPLETTWASLRNVIKEILEKNNSGLNVKELRRKAHIMIRHNHGEHLYNGLKEVVTQHLESKVIYLQVFMVLM